MKITIFGLAGIGTSTAGKTLSEKLGYTFMSTGNIMRSWADEKGFSIYEFEDKIIKEDKSFDFKLDNKVIDFGKNNNNFIFESRLAWNFIPDSFKVFLDCENLERYNRIHKREGGDLNDIKNKTLKRETELITRYNEVYPDIIFPPKNKEFDLIINVTSLSPEGVIKAILEKIK